MRRETDGYESTNGTAPAISNGSGGARTPVIASHGTHKSVGEEPNGSSRNGKDAERPPTTYLGHDRAEVTRILIQALADMGYRGAAESVSRDSGFDLEGYTVSEFRKAVLEGSWARAEDLLASAESAGEPQHTGDGLLLAPGADRDTMKFWLRQQKYLELLEQRETARALLVLRTELSPLCHEHQKLHFLSSLLMCQSTEDLKARAEWDGAYGRSRQTLLSDLSRCISPSVMLPEHRLAVLLQQVKESQVSHCLYHTSAEPPSLYSDHKCDRSRFPSEVVVELGKHSGEVWQVLFSHDGTRMASCGMDRYVIIWDVQTFEVLHKLDGHDGGVGNIAWSPDDTMIVTCGRDRYAKIWNTEDGSLIRSSERFEEPVSSCVWAADCRSFITGSFDKERAICQWNLEGHRLFTWTKKHRTEDLAVSPDGQWLVAMDEQYRLHVYNFVTRELEYEMELRVQPTSVNISQDSRFLLVNLVDGEAQLIEIATREPIQKYTGHKGGECVIRSAFGGANESFVISGSEDGSLCVWHKTTGILMQKLSAHKPRCNAVCWNPADPCMLASCGDDGKIKIWSNQERRRSFALRLQRLSDTGRGANDYLGFKPA